jgi:hypothetical protein
MAFGQQKKHQIRGIMHLTYHDSDTHTGTASTAKVEETGAPEVEITDEMIEAGERALLDIGCGDSDPSVCATVAFEAMYKVMRTSQKTDKSPSNT